MGSHNCHDNTSLAYNTSHDNENKYQFASEFPTGRCRLQCGYDGSNLEPVAADNLLFRYSSDSSWLQRQKADKKMHQHQRSHLAKVTREYAD